MTNYIATTDWQEVWMNQAFTSNIDLGQTFNSQTFTIKAASGNFNSYGLMSTKKVLSNSTSSLWWGYTTQVNYNAPIDTSTTIKQFMVLKN